MAIEFRLAPVDSVNPFALRRPALRRALGKPCPYCGERFIHDAQETLSLQKGVDAAANRGLEHWRLKGVGGR